MTRKKSPRADTSGLRKPFWLIDGRLREADFFFTKLKSSPTLEEARFMFSAFVSAAVAVRDALNTTLKKVPNAEEWWKSERTRLESDPLFDYFAGVRNDIQHQGLNPLQAQSRSYLGTSEFFLADESPVGKDAAAASERLMSRLVALAKQAYARFWSNLDMPSSYSLGDLERQGGSLEQIEGEFGLQSGWSGGPDVSGETRLERLKVYSQTSTDSLAQKYPASLHLSKAAFEE